MRPVGFMTNNTMTVSHGPDVRVDYRGSYSQSEKIYAPCWLTRNLTANRIWRKAGGVDVLQPRINEILAASYALRTTVCQLNALR